MQLNQSIVWSVYPICALQNVYNLEPTCGSASSNAATNLLTEALTSRTIDLARIQSTPTGLSDLGQCVATSAVQLVNVSAVNRELYCGFYQVSQHRTQKAIPS